MSGNVPPRPFHGRPATTVVAPVGAVALGLVGAVFGSVGSGIEPDGRFIPCGPPLFGRDDIRWDARCVAADDGTRTFVVVVLAAAVVLLAIAVAGVGHRRSARQRA